MACGCVPEMHFVLLSGLFCVTLYKALGPRARGILAKPVFKFWFPELLR